MTQALRSNIILLLLDDVGYGDIDYGDGTHVSPVQTPNIAKMAQGPHTVHFHRFYSGGAVCSPTRSSMYVSFRSSNSRFLHFLSSSPIRVTGRTPTRECIINVEENSLPIVLNQSTTAAYARKAG